MAGFNGAGAIGGAAQGAAVGSAVPVVGTAVGAGVGMLLGAFGGSGGGAAASPAGPAILDAITDTRNDFGNWTVATGGSRATATNTKDEASGGGFPLWAQLAVGGVLLIVALRMMSK